MVDRVQLASDLHMEMGAGEARLPRAAPGCRVLILAGDTCPLSEKDWRGALSEAAADFDAALVVPGNHEYYGAGASVSRCDEAMEAECYRVGNAVWLNERAINLGGVAFVGATLWTDCPADEEAARDSMNDYSMIDGGRFTAAEQRRIHARHRDFLRGALASARSVGARFAVVATHHAPDRRLAELSGGKRADGDLLPYYYASDCRHLVQSGFVRAWCHGHTHESYSGRLAGSPVLFCSNARGYPRERTGYDADGGTVDLQ